MARWGDEKTLFFIACYKDNECLWNPSSYYYKSKEARQNAYKSMLKQFNDDTLTMQLLKTKIKNVRTTYHQELNKIRFSQQTGTTHVYKPTLSWFDALHAFLGGTLQMEQTNTTPRTSIKFRNFKRKLLSSSKLDRDTSRPTNSANNLEHTPTTEGPSEDQEPSSKKQMRLVTSKMTKSKDDDTDSYKSNTPNQSSRSFDIDVASNNQMDTASAMMTTPGEDEFHFFGMNMAAQLRRLPLRTALQLQTEFQNTLYVTRVNDLASSPAADVEEPAFLTIEESDIESVEYDVDDKEFQLDIQNTIVPIESERSNDEVDGLLNKNGPF